MSAEHWKQIAEGLAVMFAIVLIQVRAVFQVEDSARQSAKRRSL